MAGDCLVFLREEGKARRAESCENKLPEIRSSRLPVKNRHMHNLIKVGTEHTKGLLKDPGWLLNGC